MAECCSQGTLNGWIEFIRFSKGRRLGLADSKAKKLRQRGSTQILKGIVLREKNHMLKRNRAILKRFPKRRRELPIEYRRIYLEHYKKNREGNTKVTYLSMRMEVWLHKKVASDVTGARHDYSTLEIGAGTLNQLRYEKSILNYDIVEPFEELYRNSKWLNRVRNIYHDIDEIDEKVSYDRITSIATFEHILDLPRVVAKAALLLNENGRLRVSIPNEGSILWRLGTKITGYEFKKDYGLDYRILMEYEHVNTANEIEHVITYFFKNVKCSVMGVNRKLAFYRFFDCSNPDLDVARTYFIRMK